MKKTLLNGILKENPTFVLFLGMCPTLAVTTAASNGAGMGLYIPLIVVNCIILGRAEAFASKNGILKSAVDGLGRGLGFTGALTIIGSIRELLGAGSLFGIELFGESFQPMTIMILPPGAFLTLGLIVMVINIISARNKKGASKIVVD